MELLLDPEQTLLKDSTRAFARRSGTARLRDLAQLPARCPAGELAQAGAAGWLTLLLPEAQGGSGLGLTELCLVAEELGAALSPLPLTAAVAGVVALARSEAPAQRAADARCRTGEALVVPAFTRTGSHDDAAARQAVPCAATAEGFVVDLVHAGAPALAYLPRARVEVTERIAVDGSVMGDVVLDPRTVSAGDLVARGTAAAELKQRLEIILALGLAAELTGLMQASASKALDYLRARQQFGRPIGAFQALQHRAVDDHVRIETARALLYEIARNPRVDDEALALACATKAKAAEAALAVVNSCIQMHGAIGFTDEHDIGLMLKRAMTLAATGGSVAAHRRRAAAFLADRGEATLPQTRTPAPADEAFRDEVRSFLARTLPADLRHLPTRPAVARAMWWHRQLYARGWIAPRWPKVHGGMEASLEQQLILAEELGRIGAPEISGQAIGHIGPILMAFGSAEQKGQHLPKMLTGEALWCQGYSEPGAGSDLASLRTTAVPDGDHLVVDGSKIWTTWGHHADWMFALVRTDPTAAKQAGISFILIDMKTPGITVRPIRTITGDDELAQVFFDQVRVPRANVVGALNDGWRIANALLAQERLQSASPQKCVALLARLKRAAARGALDDAAFRERLAAAEIETLALAAAYQHAVDLTQAGRTLGPESSYLKLAATELTQQLAGLMLEAVGSDGALVGALATDDGPLDVAGTFLQVRRETIFAGSSEIQRNIIAKRVLNLP
ncbi:MAG: acyl-CoA dehydrogenase [Hyphomicrobiales bacterium]|nr:acyl-CoA dehydrogenase [Hyphomicrobiales bacterium]